MIRNGVDVLDIARLERALVRHGDRLLRRVFTPQERALLQGQLPSLAARFAAKEAVAKALGVGIGEVSWQEIEILRGERGEPVLHLHGRARALAQRLGLHEWALSLSHTDRLAVAFVIAIGSLNSTT